MIISPKKIFIKITIKNTLKIRIHETCQNLYRIGKIKIVLYYFKFIYVYLLENKI